MRLFKKNRFCSGIVIVLRVNMDTVVLKYILPFVTLIAGEIDFVTFRTYRI